jgi:UDP-2-acetamido-3-amino-2,3-dideoxy-glucuronate N-acetyltransferase
LNATWIRLTTHDAKQGRLVSLGVQTEIPFTVERVYFIDQADPSVVRGQHAHLCGEELLICLRGSCTLTLDDGTYTSEFLLDRPDRGLHVGPMLWEEFSLSSDAVLLVVASTAYSRADYVEDRAAFLALVRHGRD